MRHNHDIFPYYLGHAKKVFPHLDCLDELKLISDLTNPPNWYPEVYQNYLKIDVGSAISSSFLLCKIDEMTQTTRNFVQNIVDA